MASIRKRGETFTITAYMGYDEQGKQRKKTTTFRPPEGVTAGKAEKLAKAFAATWEDKIRGYVALDENRTFAELATWYYSDIAPAILKPGTLNKARTDVYNHVMPRLGREKLKDITPAMLDRLFRELQESHNQKRHYRLKDVHIFDGMKLYEISDTAGISKTCFVHIRHYKSCTGETAEKIAAALGKPVKEVFDDVTPTMALSGNTVNKIKLNVSAIFTAAVKKEIMRRNPCLLATPPKSDTKPAEYMDEQQCRIFLDALHKQPDIQIETLFNLLLATGLRIGEALALHWQDIDFSTAALHVRHNLIRLNGEYVRDTPKTATSDRYIILPQYIVSMLIAHKEQQDERKVAAQGHWIVPDAVFTNKQGNYCCQAAVSPKLKRILRDAGLPETLHLHSLRHTHASLLINSDVTAKVIANRLGHATTKTTLNVYSHIFAETEVKAMQAVEMKLFTPTDE